jgi:hypothetical protein
MNRPRIERLEAAARSRGPCPHCGKLPDEPAAAPVEMTDHDKCISIMRIISSYSPEILDAVCRELGFVRAAAVTCSPQETTP